MLSDYQTLVVKAVRDDSNIITAEDIDSAIALAVIRYSQDRPRKVVADIAANGTSVFSLPDDFDVDVSQILSIEYPLGSMPPELLESDRYQLYQSPSATELLFMFAPSSAFRLTYSISHILTDLTDTLPVKHREAVTCWAAAYCCDQLASFYAQASDSTIQADHVQRNSQSKDYANQAKAFRNRYLSEVGVEEKRFTAAGTVVDLDLKSSLGRDRLIHTNRLR
jgi:hypothetical protein